MIVSMKRHWPEYLMEAAGLGLFMISACGFTVLLFHGESPVVSAIESSLVRRLLMGLAMGATAAALIYSPWGKRSGAHFNPAVTLTFLRLGRVSAADAGLYALFQAAGGITGVSIMSLLCGRWISDPSVNYAVTVPGPKGAAIAWATEFALSAVLMGTVLVVSNSPRLARSTGLFAGALVAANISLLAPLSGMSMNPARSLASAVPAGEWTAIWVYFSAPPLAMLFAAQCYTRVRGREAVFCAKLHHQNRERCIFCETRATKRRASPAAASSRNHEAAVASKDL